MQARAAARLICTATVSLRAAGSSEAGVDASLEAFAAASPSAMASCRSIAAPSSSSDWSPPAAAAPPPPYDGCWSIA